MAEAKASWLYVYAFVLSDRRCDLSVPGVNGAPLGRFLRNGVAAIASAFPEARVRPERRHLAAHQAVISHIMKQCTPLPVAFGTLARGEKTLFKAMNAAGTRLAVELERLSDTAEASVRLSLDVPNIYEYYMGLHPDLRRMRDEVFGLGSHGTPRDSRMELGRKFDELRGEDRETFAARAEAALAPHCIEVRRNAPRTDQEISTFTCLIEREGMEKLEAGVQAAATLFDDNFTIDISGPCPPYSFVDVHLDTELVGDDA